MALYVVLSKLTHKGKSTIQKKPERIKEVNKNMESFGINVVSQHALIGAYDFLTVLEAPDPQAMSRLSLELGSRGTLETLFLGAIPVDQFIEDIKKSNK